MRVRVKCVNCGTIWDRVSIGLGSDVEFTEDLQLTCPKCRSNAYDRVQPETNETKEENEK